MIRIQAKIAISAILAYPPPPATLTPARSRSAPVVRPRPPPAPGPRLFDRPRKPRRWPNRLTIRLLYIDYIQPTLAHILRMQCLFPWQYPSDPKKR